MRFVLLTPLVFGELFIGEINIHRVLAKREMIPL
jgi:hypothetical protein